MSQIRLIQQAADELAAAIQRAVEVDSPNLHIICASAQALDGGIDEFRIRSILERTPPLEPLPWLLGFGIQQSKEPVRIPPNDNYRMLGRVCIPLWHLGVLVGHLWLIDEPPLEQSCIDTAARAAVKIAELVFRKDGVLSEIAAENSELLRLILSGDEPALAEAKQRDLLPGDGRLTVRKILVDAPPGQVRNFGRELARPILHRPYLVRAESSTVTVVESPRDPADAAAVSAHVSQAAQACDVKVRACGAAEAVGDVSVASAAARARFVAQVASLTSQPALEWANSGAWRLLFGWELNAQTVRAISPHAAQLLDAPANSYWETLLVYLDVGRNVSAAANACFIHRATLHYRLDKARDIIGQAPLQDGWETAALHAALKLHAALQGKA
ncbi:helix-turn-helix domain-containing protein [Corynebacterium mayonis]|uniref:helix-turn-helix domain-containing protein n=1 Tax=Corynebacterium mayonis TaxID=3062461 RepID=UPI00314029B8